MDPAFMEVVTIISSVLASSGFWAFWQNQHDRHNASSDLLKGLAHDRIIFIGTNYIHRGWVSKDEYEDFIKYLYEPYARMGGNGTAKKIMEQVEQLPWSPTSEKENK